ncbi:MAG TPA: carboxylating nicotinate-nucleotide diphosphorylase [Vicinamibacterales bacterium]|nr:carboxylating nicotinate-nucleotide diphosphorylase [Vicinamibacterales bacterium]
MTLPPRTDHLIDLALDEDAGLGDVTSRAIFPATHQSTAVIEAREPLVAAGVDVAARVFERVDATVRVTMRVTDGLLVRKGTALVTVKGPTRALLTAERTALNFLQHLSGIATLSRRFADAVAGTGVRVVDTRKTTPGWRALEKAAVRAGGCANHRSSLGEHVLIKDNHIAAAGSVRRAMTLARAEAPHIARIEVEAATLAEVRSALAAGADAILLDNMTPADVRRAVALVNGRALIEVSGGVTLDTIRSYCVKGVAVVSVGALTHSAPAVDISMRIRS